MDTEYFNETELEALKKLLARVGFDPDALDDICDTNELDIVQGRDGQSYAILWDENSVYAFGVEDEYYSEDIEWIRRNVL